MENFKEPARGFWLSSAWASHAQRSRSDGQRAHQDRARKVCRGLTHGAFALLLVLLLSSPTFWKQRPWQWQPFWGFPDLSARPPRPGILGVLPAVVVVMWIALYVQERSWRKWCWGRVGITLPLLGLMLLAAVRMSGLLRWYVGHLMVGWGLAWLVYFFLLNERPRLVTPLSLVILLQSGVGIGQFLLQRSLGLKPLGELALDRHVSGYSVLWARGERWLRAYGLTAHPNFLGATLAVLLLLLLSFWLRSWQARSRPDRVRPGLPLIEHANSLAVWFSRGREVVRLLVVAVGFLGLLVSFSRAAWLGFAAGFLLWAVTVWLSTAGQPRVWQRIVAPIALTLLTVSLIFLALYGDMVAGRLWHLDTPLEARSLWERGRGVDIALTLMAHHPWQGVGVGKYLLAAWRLDRSAVTVHNVPLLLAAELGLPGAMLWVWLALTPFVRWRWRNGPGRSAGVERAARPGLWLSSDMAAWLALLVISLFDTTLWWTASWSTAVLLAILAAHVSHSVALEAPEAEIGGGPLHL